jgi:hypothetical protein
MHLRRLGALARAEAGDHRQTRRWKRLCAAAVAILPLSLLVGVAGIGTASASGGTVTYTATVNVPAPPATNFAGAAGGDGWGLAFTSSQLFNVFHHDAILQINCHNQSNASQCWSSPVTITDTGATGDSFATSAQPGLTVDPNNGNVYVYVTRYDGNGVGTAGVECITPSASSASSCGFTPLSGVGEAPLNGPPGSGWSEISDPVQVGSSYYALNYFDSTSSPSGTEDELMCFSFATLSACPNQPYKINFGAATAFWTAAPAPSIVAVAGQIVIPVPTNASGAEGPTTLGCYDPATGGTCPSSATTSWPVLTGVFYAGANGGGYPLLDSSGETIGVCLPTGNDPCYNLDGGGVATPPGMTGVIAGNQPWNGPGLAVGPRVYVPFQGSSSTAAVECYDYFTDSGCSNYPKTFGGTITNGPYTVDADPQRPTCVWVNSDSGSAQIQNFDAYTAGACNQFPIRLLASSIVVPEQQCVPTQWTQLQVTSPYPASQYGGGSVEFENLDGQPLAIPNNPASLGANGAVNLSGYDFSSTNELPDFALTLNTPQANLTDVTISASWEGSPSSGCTQPGTGISGSVTLTGPAASSAIGQSQTLSAVVDAVGSPVEGGTVTFTCVSGPNCAAVPSGSGTTDSTGTATFAYTGRSPGTDTWDASYTPPSAPTETSGQVGVVWTKITSTEAAVIALTAACSASWGSSQPLGASACASATLPVTPNGAPLPTGTVTYDFFGNQFCAGTASATDPVTISGATVPSSATGGNPAFGPLTPGTYSVQAVYSGDGNYTGATSPCATFTVTKVSPALSVGPVTTGSGVTGASATDAASLTGVQGFTPTGTVLYELFGNGACSGTPGSSYGVTLSQGKVPTSPSVGPLAAGSYSFRVVYLGDSNYNTVTAETCQPFTISKAGTTTGQTIDDAATNGPWLGTEETNSRAYDSAAVTPAASGTPAFLPGGTVDYYFYLDDACTVQASDTQVTLAQGLVPASDTQLTGTTPPLRAGTHSFEAVYGGDSNYTGSHSACDTFYVGIAPQTISSVVWDYTGDTPWGGNPAAEVTGASAFDTSSVPASSPARVSVEGSPVIPTGTVTYSFFDNGTCSGDTNGSQTVTLYENGTVPPSSATSGLAAGSYSYKPIYSGDTNYDPVTGSCEPFTVAPAPTTIGAAVGEGATGSPWGTTPADDVTGATAFASSSLGGVVDGFTPTGNVTYELYKGSGVDACDGNALFSDTETLGGGLVPDSVDTSPLAAGRYYFEATYSGDSNYDGSTSGCVPFVVAQAPLSLFQQVFDVPPGGLEQTGSQAYDTVTLTGVPGFPAGGTLTYYFYGNSTCSNPLTDPTAETVTVTDGSVPFSSDTPPLPAGTYSYDATYNGDSNYLPDQQSTCQTFSVGQATPTVTVAANDVATEAPWLGTEVTGASAYATAEVTGIEPFTPTGTMSFALYDNGTCSGDPAQTWPPPTADGGLGGSSGPTQPLAGGTYSFVAGYNGDGNYLPATSACAPFTVLPAPSIASGVVHDSATHGLWTGAEHQGAAAYDTAAVRGLPAFPMTGTLTYTFYRNASCLGPAATTQTVPVSAGSVPASASTGELPSGGLSFLATYNGDSNYLGSQSGCQSFSAQITGYRLQGGDGGLFAFHDSYRGSVGFPSPPGLGLKIYNFVGMAPAANGYWMVQSTGGIFRFGSAAFHGSLPGLHISVNDIVGIAATPDFGGYWMVSRSGHVYSFGDAHYHGGANATDIVAIVSPDAGGYWLLGSNGAVYPLGDAKHLGDCTKKGSGCQGATNIVGFASPDAGGYWLVSKTGGVYGFGDAHYRGSCWTAGSGCFGATDIVGIAGPDENGYWLAGAKGEVHAFGDALPLGNEVGAPLVRPMVAISR